MRCRPLLVLLLGSCHQEPSWPLEKGAPWRVVLTHDGVGEEPPMGRILLQPGDPETGQANVFALRSGGPSAWTASGPTPGGCGDADCGWSATLASPRARGVLARVGDGAVVEVVPPKMNHAEVVAAAQLRMQELAWRVLDLPEGQWPGPGDPDPRKTSLRTIVKVRRPSAPPIHLATGDAECIGLVALFNDDGKKVLDWLHVDLPGPKCAPLASVPPTDLDGDGEVEAVVYAGNGDPGVGVFRGVIRIHLEGSTSTLVRVWKRSLFGECFEK